MALLEVKNLGISFGGLRAVNGYDISIEKEALYGLIGPTGAGKTTVFNLLTGVYKPDSGKVLLDGTDITGKNTIEINKAGIARTFQNIRLFKQLSVLDNVKVGLHNKHHYSTLSGVLRLPGYRKVEKEMDEEKLEEKFLKELKLDGIVNADESVLDHMEHNLSGTSRYLPIGKNKDGSLSKNSKVLTQGEFAGFLRYTKEKEQELKTDGSVFSTTRPIFVPKRQKSCFQKRRRRLRKLI